MLVLLIIFMVLSPLLIQGVEVDLPQTDTTKMSVQNEPLVISIDKNGNYFINVGEESLPIDLNEYLVENSAATFYIRVSGNSMQDEGIDDGDLLVVDRSKNPKNNDIVIGVLNGEFTVKKIQKTKTKLFMVAANKEYKKIEITEEMDFSVWGVVTYVIHKTR